MSKKELRIKRANRVRLKLKKSSNLRLSLFRSSKHIYVQLIDDSIGKTLPMEKNYNAWNDLTNFSWKLQKIRQAVLFSLTVWNSKLTSFTQKVIAI